MYDWSPIPKLLRYNLAKERREINTKESVNIFFISFVCILNRKFIYDVITEMGFETKKWTHFTLFKIVYKTKQNGKMPLSFSMELFRMWIDSQWRLVHSSRLALLYHTSDCMCVCWLLRFSSFYAIGFDFGFELTIFSEMERNMSEFLFIY